MKKVLLYLFSAFLLVFASPNLGFSQVFWTEDFETDGAGTRYTLDAVDDEFNDGSSDHYGRTNGTGTSGGYSGQSNSFYWAGEDIDDNGGNGNNPKTVTFNAQTITGMTDVRISGLFAQGTSGGGGVDVADFIEVEYRIDAGAWTTVLMFAGINNGDATNNGAALDTDGDDVGDGTALTNTFASFSNDISVSGNSLQIRVTLASNSGSEELAYDFLQFEDISGGGSTPSISLSESSLTGFSTTEGTESATQTFTISGDNLTGDLALAGVTGYEFSLDNSAFTNGIVNIPVSGGDVTGEPLTVYVRLTGASIGTPSGNAAVSGGGATAVNVALDGTVTAPPAAPCSDLFISEYVEGSSNNKYIEIYNPTSSAINLATGNYSLRLYANGASTPTNDVALSGSIAAFATVVYQNSGETAYTGTGIDNAAVNFNGDDAIALVKNGTEIDIFGRIGNDPGTAWTLGGNTTVNKSLVRNATVQAGIDVSPTGTGATAFTTLSTEWTQFNIDDVSNLGSHTCDCFVALPVVTLSINTATGTEAATTAITLTATADAPVTGNQTVEVALTGTGLTSTDFSGVNFLATVTIIIGDGATTGTRTFSVANDTDVEGPETATFTLENPSAGIVIGTPAAVNLAITDDDNVTSSLSVIDGVGGEAASISSLTNGTITNNTQGTQVWQFNLYDGNGTTNDADDKATIYQGFTIRQSGGNTVPLWNDAIDNVKFFLGASATPISGSFLVSPSTITFTPTTAITVGDGTTPATISMRLTLDALLPSGSDGQHFGFSLTNADVTVETDPLLASQLGTFTETSNAALNGIDITATLQFIDAPAAVSLGNNFSVTVSAVDANGNVDTGVSNSITLSLTSGSGTLTGDPSTANLSSGTHTFTGLSHDTEEVIQITIHDNGNVFTDLTANINVTDEPHQLFDDFNRANSNTVGVPSSGGSTSWTEDGLFSNEAHRVAVDGNQLYLGGCVAGTSSGSTGSTGMEQVRFDCSALYETTFDNAGSQLEWLFNMKQTRTNPSGFGGSTYAGTVVLGCDENDFESVNADGYAVVIGNGGTPDPVKLIRFTNGLSTDVNVTDVAVSGQNDADAYYSVKVTFDPCTGLWSLFVRSDGTSAFAAPNVGSLGAAVTGTDQTHTGLDLKYFGAGWQHSSSCGEYLRVDNLNIPNATTASTTAKVWNGSISADWNVAGNWGPCAGVPTATDNVQIPNVANDPVVSSNPVAVCDDITIASGALLTVNTGFAISVSGVLTNNGTVIVQNSGSLVQTAGSTNAGSGNYQIKRQGSSSASVYNYWSSPVTAYGSVPGSTSYRYDADYSTQDYGDDFDPDPGWFSYNGTMTPGIGYAGMGAGLVTFTGTINNGNVSAPMDFHPFNPSNTGPGTPFNLMGNPYPCAISAAALVGANTDVFGSIYYWDDDLSGGSGYASTDYAVWNGTGSVGGGGNTPNGYISSGQGFMIRALNNGASLDFTNSMRVTTPNTQFFKTSAEESRIWIDLEGNNSFNQVLIGILEDATDEEDRLYDAVKLRSPSQISLGIVDNGFEYAIMAFPPSSAEKVVPLTVVATGNGQYTFTASTMEGFSSYVVYFSDSELGTYVQLHEGQEIEVNLNNGVYENRFFLNFMPATVTGIVEEASAQLLVNEYADQLTVRLSDSEVYTGSLEVLSANGQQVVPQLQATLGTSGFVLNTAGLANGVYLVRFVSGDSTFVSRFIKL